jgi:hypothetical protein
MSSRPFTGALTNSCKDGITAVLRRDASNQFGKNNGLAQSCTAEQSSFTTADERSQQINNLDPRLEQLGTRRQIRDLGRCTMNWPPLLRCDWASAIDGFA